MKRVFTLAAVATVGMVVPDAHAQRAPTRSGCYYEVNIVFTVGCGRAAISRQLLIHNADILSDIIAGNLHDTPDEVVPASLEDMSVAALRERLSAPAAIRVEPTADAAVDTAITPPWNAWIDGKYTWQDNSAELADMDGPLWNGLAGIDYRLTDALTIGVMGSYESSDLDGLFAAEQVSDGWGIGPYIGIVLSQNIVLSSSLLYSTIDTDFQPGSVDYDSDRVQAAGALTGYWYHGTWRFTPALSVSWAKEWMDETTGVAADETIETGILTPSLQIGDTLALSDTSSVEPWLGTALDWTFLNKVKIDGFGTDSDPSVDLRLQGGLNFAFGTSVQLSLLGEVGGLILDDLNTYAGEAMFSFQF